MEAILLGVIILLTVAAFVSDRWPIDLVSFVSLGALLLFGLVTPEQATSGFSNPAVVTVMMMFILSETLVASGAVARLGARITRLSGESMGRGALLLLLLCGSLSAFVNNVAAVAILMPVAIQLAKHYHTSPSKILLPLSWVSIFGGMCTLIGTSTNLLVAALAEQHGMSRFTMFEFLPVGLVLFGVGVVYTVLVPLRYLPSRAILSSLTRKYHMSGYLTEAVVPQDSGLIGLTVADAEIHRQYQLNVLEILRGEQKIAIDLRNTPLESGDLLLVRGAMEDIFKFRENYGLLLLTDTKLGDLEVGNQGTVLAEVQIAPMASVLGETIKDLDFRRRFGCFVLALNRTGEMIRSKITSIPLQTWDILLVHGQNERVEALGRSLDFVPLQHLDLHLSLKRRWWIGALVVPIVATVAALGWVSILKASVLGVVAVLITGNTTTQQAYKAINWTVIFLVVTMIPLGTALENTGLAAIAARGIATIGETVGPLATLAALFLLAFVLTEFVSANSTAIMMVPIAITTASSVGLDPKPFVMAVAFAASAGFLTPMARTNAMVFGPGGYRFMDSIRFGMPLKILVWLVGTLLIPQIWPFQAMGS